MSSLRERRRILTFLGITFLLSWLLMGFIISRGGLRFGGLWILLLMWVPGLTSLAYRFFAKIGFDDVGWRPGRLQYWLLAVATPLLVASISYSISWLTGVSELSPAPEDLLIRNGVSSPLVLVLTAYPISFVFGCLAALGEELGWRGFLIPKLYKTTWKYPLILSSVIWGVWHLPLILWGGYASSDIPLLSAALFLVMILCSGVFVGWLRMTSGSVWVAMAYHAAHNLFLQTAFEVFNKPGRLSQYLSGESGVIPCLVYILVLFIGYKLLSRTSFWSRAGVLMPEAVQ